MKQILLILISASMFGVTKAQVSYGVKGGLNLSHDVFHDLSYVSKFKAGFHAGGFAGFPIVRKLSIQLELMYSAQGSKSSYADIDSISNLHYLNLPVLVKYSATSGFYVETGPQAGFLMAVKTTPHYEGMKRSYDRADFSWAFGIGYKSALNVGIDLRYNLGLTSLFWESGRYVNNNAFQLGLFYVLRSK